MQHFRVKVFAVTEAGFDLGAAIPVFHRWIQQNRLPELLVDVADYRHVPAGPGILLVGQDAFYGMDNTGNRFGLLYTRRTALEGAVAERLQQAVEAAFRACDLLEREPEFAGRLRFGRDEYEVSVNDRALAPNTDETWRALEPVLRAVCGTGRIKRTGDGPGLFTVRVMAAG